jgi:transposase
VDRAEPGGKHHVITDGNGTPLASSVTAAKVNDIRRLAPRFNAIPPVGGKPGRPRRRPDAMLGDRGYDPEPDREGLRQLGVVPNLAEKGTENGSGLGVFRWVVERRSSRTHQDRRLRIRYERRADLHQAFLTIACIQICASFLLSESC